MAGDWIKMRTDLRDDPAVIAVAAELGIEEDLVVGKLHRLWSWGNRQTTDGNAIGVTELWIDRYLCVTGFANALTKVGWLLLSGQGISIPHFDVHNGQSAKRRALTAKRVARFKVTHGALPREEKRREESNTPIAPKGADRDYSKDFLDFWSVYPCVRKGAKPVAWKAWAEAIKRKPAADILKAAGEFAASPLAASEFCPGPAPWLNQDRWDDDRKCWQRNGRDAPADPVDIPIPEHR